MPLSTTYLSGMHRLLRGDFNLDTDRFGLMLVTNRYEPDARAHIVRADVDRFEASGPGYERGGQAVVLTSKISDYDHKVGITLAGATWLRSTITARYSVYYRDVGHPEEDDLLLCLDHGADISSVRGKFIQDESTIWIAV